MNEEKKQQEIFCEKYLEEFVKIGYGMGLSRFKIDKKNKTIITASKNKVINKLL